MKLHADNGTVLVAKSPNAAVDQRPAIPGEDSLAVEWWAGFQVSRALAWRIALDRAGQDPRIVAPVKAPQHPATG